MSIEALLAENIAVTKELIAVTKELNSGRAEAVAVARAAQEKPAATKAAKDKPAETPKAEQAAEAATTATTATTTAAAQSDGPTWDDVTNKVKQYSAGDNIAEKEARKAKVMELLGKVKLADFAALESRKDLYGPFINAMNTLIAAGNVLPDQQPAPAATADPFA